MAAKTASGYVHTTLWRITLANASGSVSEKGEPLFIAGDTLADVESVFRKWDDMGYEIVGVSRVGRVVAWRKWRITGDS